MGEGSNINLSHVHSMPHKKAGGQKRIEQAHNWKLKPKARVNGLIFLDLDNSCQRGSLYLIVLTPGLPIGSRTTGDLP